jgi:hypothetical protein
MMGQAVLAQFEADFGVGQEAPEKVTYIPLDGEGTVEVRVDKWVIRLFVGFRSVINVYPPEDCSRPI